MFVKFKENGWVASALRGFCYARITYNAIKTTHVAQLEYRIMIAEIISASVTSVGQLSKIKISNSYFVKVMLFMNE